MVELPEEVPPGARTGWDGNEFDILRDGMVLSPSDFPPSHRHQRTVEYAGARDPPSRRVVVRTNRYIMAPEHGLFLDQRNYHMGKFCLASLHYSTRITSMHA